MKARRLIALFLVMASLLTMVPAVFAEEASETDKTTYDVTVQYLYNGTTIQVSNSWTGTYSAGSSDARTIIVPVTVGYAATAPAPVADVQTELTDGALSISFENLSENKTITVYYIPTYVDLTVKFYQQNVADDEYTLVSKDTKVINSGKTGDAVSKFLSYENATVKVNDETVAYAGFTPLWFDTSTVLAADGSTVVEIYFDRDYSLIKFDLGGGYGVDPIYAKVDSAVDTSAIGTPTRPGYTFDGWYTDNTYTTTATLPSVMPSTNVTYYAKWTAVETAQVTVVYWGENANDEEYSYIGSAIATAVPGTELDVNDLSGILYCNTPDHTHTDACAAPICGQPEHTHSVTCYAGATSTTGTPGGNNVPSNPVNGQVYKRGGGNNNNNNQAYIYFNDLWYVYTGNVASGSIAAMSCNGHVHTASCYSCGMLAHTHSSACYSNSTGLTDINLWTFISSDQVTVAADGSTVINVYYDRTPFTITFKDGNTTVKTLTRKWGADISDHWPVVSDDGKTTYDNGERWDPSGSDIYNQVLVYMAVMPAESFTLTKNTATYSEKTMNYYVEALPGTEDTVQYTYDGTIKSFVLDSSIVAKYNYITESEDFFDLEGFTQWTSDPTFSNDGKINDTTANFYYIRNSYILDFNNGEGVVRTESVLYEASLDTYGFTPEKPSYLEASGYTFGGWYLNPECTGDEYVLSSHKMPASNVILYAKWVPVTHNVKVYLDSTKTTLLNDTNNDGITEIVSHRAFATEPTDVTNQGMALIGWFYMDNGVEKAFDFSSMQITRDMEIYGKWKATDPVAYTINYVYTDENGTTHIAESTTGQALPGSSITFEAKVGAQLNEDYQVGYFPKTASHTVDMQLLKSDGTNPNDYDFEYVKCDTVEYTVRYLEVGTEVALHDPKTVTTTNAVVTEYAEIIKGYAVDATQKRVVLSGTEKNEITFWYTVDTEHAYVTVLHITEDAYGNQAEYSRSQTQEDIGSDATANKTTISGYVLDRVYVDDTQVDKADSVKVTVEEDGVEVKFIYVPNGFYVHHQDGNVDYIPMSNVEFDGTYDITAKTYSDKLYGGHYDGTVTTSDAGTKTYSCDYKTPLTDSGLNVTPDIGEHFYLKEVDQSYLQPRIWYWYDTRDNNKVKQIYLLTAVDDTNYIYVGFDVDGASMKEEVTDTNVAAEIQIKKYNSTAGGNLVDYATLVPGNVGVKSGLSGLLNIQTYSTTVSADQEFTFNAFWVTMDGVKVTGASSRSYDTGDGCYYPGVSMDTTDGLHYNENSEYAGSVCSEYIEPSAIASYSTLTARTTYTMVISDEPETYTITLVDGKTTTTETVEAGDYTGTFTPAGKKGYLFAGWYTNSTYTTPADFSDVQSDMTVYAKYIKASDVTTTVVRSGSRLQTKVVVPTGDFTEVGFEYVSKTKNGSVVCSSKTKLPVSTLDRILGKNTTKYQYAANWMLNSLKTGTTFTVIPYWVTADGTVVHGEPITYVYIFGAIVKC